jgi:hypothetical protein
MIFGDIWNRTRVFWLIVLYVNRYNTNQKKSEAIVQHPDILT